MNNKQILYVIIGVLVLINIALLSYVFGVFRAYRGYGMMGGMGGYGSMMMHNDDDYQEHWEEHSEFETWEDMVNHMQEEHNYEQ